MIDDRAVRTLFQPVVHLASGSVAGYEALTRGPAGSSLESPLDLLEQARQSGRLGELDWLCRTQAMLAASQAGLPESLSWLINVEPAGLAMDCPTHLLAILDRARADLRVIVEVVERDTAGNVLELIHATDQARRDGWGVALDDVGAEEASLALLPFVRPDVVKLDMSLVRGIPRSAAATTTAAVRAYAESRGAVILAEGIETFDQEKLAKVFGATYGQGYFYGRPGPLPATLDVPSHPIPLRQHVAPIDGRTPFEILSATIEPQRAPKSHLLHISAHLESAAARGSHASVLLTGFQDHKFFTAAKAARYRTLAASNALTIVRAFGVQPHDEPTFSVGAIPAGSRLADEWVVIVVSPHYACAFVARDCGDAGPDEERRFDFIYTHNKDAVIDAGRCFIQDLATPHQRHAIGERAITATPPETPLSDTAPETSRIVVRDEPLRLVDLSTALGSVGGGSFGFRTAAKLVLDFLNSQMSMGFWSVTRVENDRQTYLFLDDNDYELSAGDSHPWEDSYCISMAAGTAPRIAPDAAAVPLYAAARVNATVQIGAYAGAPIAEPDGTLFGAICGLDRLPRRDIADFEPTLNVLSGLLSLALASDRALTSAEHASSAALTYATTDSMTGIHNRFAWDRTIAQLDDDYRTYADPTVVVIIDLDFLKKTNDGAGGHTAGDQLLRTAAKVMQRSVRSQDFLARIGGDEFGMILTGMPAVLAPETVKRLSRALDRAGISASIGWSALLPDGTVRTAIDLADASMYQAKKERRQLTLNAS